MNIDGLVTAEFTRAVEQVLKGEKAEMTEVQAQGMVQEFMKEQQEIAGREVREAGEKFLAENAKRDGVTTTASGLQYEVLTEAIGQKPVATDSVRCHYEGRLIDGTVFDSSYQRGESASFPVSGVVPGWQITLKAMHEGDEWEVYIPQYLGYGANGTGNIPPYSTLIFK